MIGNNIEYIKAYTEINCLLRYFPKQYLKKLPEKLIRFIDENSNKEFEIEIDYKASLDKQNLSKKTYDILAVLKYNYWSTEEEKEYIREKLTENEKIFQKELSEKYNVDNLFSRKATENSRENKEMQALVRYKEKDIIQRIISKIKSFFNKR